MPGSSETPLMSSSLEVTEIQEDLVRLNLKIKSLNKGFASCSEERDMEALNEEVRDRLDAFRRRLLRLEELSKGQRSKEAGEMLMTDVNSHRDQVSSSTMYIRTTTILPVPSY